MKVSLLDISNYASLFLLGTINNFSYCVVSSASQDIATHFNQGDNIGFVPWANICMGLFFQVINAIFLQGVPHNWRILLACSMHLAGLLGLGLTVWLDSWGFWLSLLAIMSIGAASTLGEIVILGFLKVFNNDIVSAFSSGTGMAGVAGSFTYLLLGILFGSLFGEGVSKQAWPLSVKFLSFSPLVLIYIFIWFSVLKTPTTSKIEDYEANVSESQNSFEIHDENDRQTLLPRKQIVGNTKNLQTEDILDQPIRSPNHQEYEVEEYIIESLNQETMLNRITKQILFILRCFKMCWWRSLNLMLVYFLEYVINIGCANVATIIYKDSGNFFEYNGFRILGFCYQFGVLISRSSLKLVKIKRVYIITLLQFIMFVFWLFEGKFRFLPVYILFPLMLFVGLLGGSSYVQVYYLLLSDQKMTEEEREMCVNICAIGVTVGITSASLAIMLLNATLYHGMV